MRHLFWTGLKRAGAVALAAALAVTGMEVGSLAGNQAVVEAEAATTEFESAEDAVANMRIGWNLGNTLDSYSKGLTYTDYVGKEGSYTILTGGSAVSTYASLSTYSWGQQLVVNDDTIRKTLTGNGYDLTYTITLAKAATGSLQVCAGGTAEFSVATLDTDKDGVITLTGQQIINAIGSSAIDTSYEHLQISGGNTFTKVVAKLTAGSNGSYTSVFETAWGNVVTTKDMIASVKEQGFNAVRLPVTYIGKMDSNGNVDSQWLDRVQEIVDWCLEEDLYVIINVHHDTAAGDDVWVIADNTVYKNTKSKYETLWKNIATRFKNYDQRLLFEGYNEMLDSSDTWTAPRSTASYTAVNNYAQSFVTAVRSTGGNNATRNLIVTTYSASFAATQISNLTIPTDTTTGHLIMEVHYYQPDEFVYGGAPQDASWLSSVSTVWTAAMTKEVQNDMKQIATSAKAKGVPVIIGEFSATYADNEAEQAKYVDCIVSSAREYGITCFYWDNGAYQNGSSAILNRKTMTWRSTMTAAMIKAACSFNEDTSLPTPTVTGITSSGSNLVVSWDAVDSSDISGYVIYRSANGSSYEVVDLVNASATSYTDTTATAASYGYSYKVASYHGADRSAMSTAVTSLATPIIRNVGFTSKSATRLYWNAVSGAAGYVIYRKEAGGSFTKIATVASTVTNYKDTDSSLDSGKQYYYAVKAYATFNNGTKNYTSYSTYKQMYTVANPVMTNVTATSNYSTTSNTVTWSKCTGATGYYVYRKEAGGSYAKVATVTGTSYTDSKAVAGTSYYYCIRAYRTAGSLTMTSWNSNSMSSLAVATVRNVTVPTGASTSRTIYWTQSTGATGYYVYRKTASGSYSKIATVKGASTLTYTDTTAAANTVYYYTVKAYRSNSNGTKSYSAAISSGVANLATPTLTSVSASAKGKNVLKWNTVSSATGYYVYRKTASGSYTKIATVTTGTYTDTTAVSGTAYTYTVKAIRSANSITAMSNMASSKTVTTK